MKRREFIVGLSYAAVGWPFSLTYAQAKTLRVGIATSPPSSPVYAVSAGSVRKAMAELGYEEGQDFKFEEVFLTSGRRTQSEHDRVFRELAARNVDIFVALGLELQLKSAITVAGKKPIVMVAVNWDPMARQYISSLAQPGGNITGVIFREVELTLKRFELLKEMIPSIEAATVFWDHASADQWQEAEVVAARLGLRIHGVKLSGPAPYDFEAAFAGVPSGFRDALVVLGSPLFAFPKRRTLPDFALRHRIPTMFVLRPYVDHGGLVSYGPNYPKMFGRAAYFIDRIAKGARPADLPVELPKQFELAVNLKTASLLGMTIPPSILVRADKVIE